MIDRFSKAKKPPIIGDPRIAAPLESENALLQTDAALTELEQWINSPTYKLRVSIILRLHRILMSGLSEYAGLPRPDDVEIEGSRHTPPPADAVPRLLEDFCDYVSDHWKVSTPLHLASYVLWRINWIHPFTDGNGRTARCLSYLVLCARLGYQVPGGITIPDQISSDKEPYYKALERADTADEGTPDVTAIERLLDTLLARQLLSVQEQAKHPAQLARVRPLFSRRKGSNDTGRDGGAGSFAQRTLSWVEAHPALSGLIGVGLTILVTIVLALIARWQ